MEGGQIGDIEDMFTDLGDPFEVNERPVRNHIARKVVKRRKPKIEEDTAETKEEERKARTSVPGAQNVFVKTQGCSHNISDSEYMMGLLVEYGYKLVETIDDADICLLNSCTVKNPS
jgi:threonylcarbamoyladenosine tRNA methylthiotransferase CDKAL1